MTDKPISPLRQRMIEDMTARHFAEKAQKDYNSIRQELRGYSRPLQSFSASKRRQWRENKSCKA
jgi:hypothetical protein